MATIENLYTGDGSTVLYSFTFPYIDESDIKVSVDGVDLTVTTEYSLANSTTIEFVTAPASAAAIRIYRSTEVDAAKATFFPGSAIRAQDLNDNFEQQLFVVQEASFDTSQSAADSAAALTAANAANTTAAAAETKATAAQTDAASAVTTANSANTTAASANSLATQAQTDAASAISAVAAAAIYLDIANVAAISASPTDGDRVRVLDATGIASFTPLSGLPTGPTYDSGLFVRLVYNGTATSWEFVDYGANDPDDRYSPDALVSGDNVSELTNDAGYLSGSSSISALTDVDTSSAGHIPTDGQALVWDQAMGHWMPGTVASGGGGGIAEAPQDGKQYARKDAGWEEVAASGGGGTATIGAIVAWANSTVPTGWLECDGSAIPSQYTDLIALIGANTPDLRGEFIRGWDNGRGVDSGRSLLSTQDSANKAHTHTINDPGHAHSVGYSNKYGVSGSGDNAVSAGSGVNTTSVTTGITIDSEGEVEARPRNVALMYIINADGSSIGGGSGGSTNVQFTPANQQVALIVDQKTAATDGGTSTAGWQVRDLNTEVYDDDSLVSISNNGFTLVPGEYLLEWSAPGYDVASFQTALSTSTSDSNIIAYGNTAYTASADSVQVHSSGSYKVSITSDTTYYILQHHQSGRDDYGLGVATDVGPEIYTQVKITNLAGVNVDAAGDVITNNYSGAAAWGAFDASGAFTGGLNVASVTKTTTGSYDVVFSTPMPSDNYAVNATGNLSSDAIPFVTAKSSTGFTVKVTVNGGGYFDQGVSFTVHALNALPPKGGTGTDAWASVEETTTNGAARI